MNVFSKIKLLCFEINAPEDFQVLILGAGVSGICMGKKLNDLGIRCENTKLYLYMTKMC